MVRFAGFTCLRMFMVMHFSFFKWQNPVILGNMSPFCSLFHGNEQTKNRCVNSSRSRYLTRNRCLFHSYHFFFLKITHTLKERMLRKVITGTQLKPLLSVSEKKQNLSRRLFLSCKKQVGQPSAWEGLTSWTNHPFLLEMSKRGRNAGWTPQNSENLKKNNVKLHDVMCYLRICAHESRCFVTLLWKLCRSPYGLF